ncbi:hypothetical protein EOD41_18035 [Mucilaginibacter limnophilus]|uniref:Uncharacterized protein n=1 Tax=Mucilaginibacter limnophilus TaxID=1932778 RepID=A0A3S2UJD7_9SPHI|nr:hypothetical protein [Mucilaginibacter limnophilus]RVT98270.1 hypothetical protein EOD41_18035 [Mucilaginibacter limnophilus]
MVLPPIIVSILTYTLSGAGVVWVAYYLFKPYLDTYKASAEGNYKVDLQSQALPLKLQAYERLVLFIERINPVNMLVRLNAPTFSAAELQHLIMAEIRNEYQHNVTQQLYVSARAWDVAKKIKDDTLSVINGAAQALPVNATGTELAKTILTALSTMDTDPYGIGITLIKKDLENLL